MPKAPKTNFKTKKGATTIYATIFVIVIVTILVLGFIRLIISEQKNTTNADLSQSAYDSALAGVEDAKLSVIQYRNCRGQDDNVKAEGNSITCGEIRNLMNQVGLNSERCDLIPAILGRVTVNGETPLLESKSTQSALDTSQAYTCVKMGFSLPDYRATLNSGNSVHIVPLEGGVINGLSKVRIGWYSDNDGTTYNFNATKGNSAEFPSAKDPSGVTIPPVLSVQLIQADGVFTLDDFDYSRGSYTDRGTLILTPSDQSGSITFDNKFTKANDKTISNQPLIVNCPSEHDEFACTATLNLPTPVQSSADPKGDSRIREFAFLVLSLPYNQPTTSFSVEMLDNKDNVIYFEGAQVAIDSTGRANDLFSRVEARAEMSDIYFPYPTYGVQLNGSGDTLEKNFFITPYCHWTSHQYTGDQTATCNTTGSAN